MLVAPDPESYPVLEPLPASARRSKLRRHSLWAPLPRFSSEDDGQKRGLQFFATCADIKRQFELVQRWINASSFTCLYNPDALTADLGVDGQPETVAFIIPGEPVPRSIKGIQRFVKTRGGAYVFLPSHSTLSFLAGLEPVSGE